MQRKIFCFTKNNFGMFLWKHIRQPEYLLILTPTQDVDHDDDHLHPSLQVQHVLFMVSGVFYYFNSILNPILYTILSKRFRRGFSDISGKCWVYQVYDFRFKFWPENDLKPCRSLQKLCPVARKRKAAWTRSWPSSTWWTTACLCRIEYFSYQNLSRWSMWRGGRPTARGGGSSTLCPRSGERRSWKGEI